ncbi:hypothetical protein [Spirillospora sp. NPDC047279]|uniref:hypothetical protein n=1 Tax=Spirillospora sp. NPDC047279 TaxID=3155478 RepID=UPI00340546C5
MIRNSRRVVALAIAGAVAIAPVITGCGAGETPQSAAPTQLTEAINASVPQGDKVSKIDIRNMFLLGPQADKAFPQGSSLPLYGVLINQVKAPDRLVAVSSPNFAQARVSGGALTLPAASQDGVGSVVNLLGPASAAATPTPKPAKPSGGAAKPTETPSPGATASPESTATPESPAASESPAAPESPGATASASPGASATTTPPAAETPVSPTGKGPLVVLTGLTGELRGGETIKVTLQFEKAGSIELSVPVIPQQGEFTEYVAVSAGVPVPGAATSPSATPTGGGAGHGGSEQGTPTQGGGHETTAPATSESPAAHG